MKTLSINIDVTKIEKQRLYVGKKGTYLDAVVFLRNEKDEYGNDGFVVQSVSEEERKSGTKGQILGNVKIIGQKEEPKVQPKVEEDGLPF